MRIFSNPSTPGSTAEVNFFEPGVTRVSSRLAASMLVTVAVMVLVSVTSPPTTPSAYSAERVVSPSMVVQEIIKQLTRVTRRRSGIFMVGNGSVTGWPREVNSDRGDLRWDQPELAGSGDGRVRSLFGQGR